MNSPPSITAFLRSLIDQLHQATTEQQSHAAVKTVQERLADVHSYYTDPTLHRFALQQYEDTTRQCGLSILAAGAIEYPCCYVLPPETQIHDVDSALGHLSSQIPDLLSEAQLVEYQELMFLLTDKERPEEQLGNGDKFALSRIRSVNPLKIDCHPTKYSKVLSSGDALKFELLWQWKHRREGENVRLDQLPVRSFVHKALPHLLHSAYAMDNSRLLRSPGIAVSTLICYNDGTKYKCILRKRSAVKVAEGRGLWHVIPAAGFEPSALLPIKDSFSITDNILREYAEELFNQKEPKNNSDPEWYLHTPYHFDGQDYFPAKALQFLLNDRTKASLHLTGIAIDFLELRPQICTLLLIRDPSWKGTWLHRMTVCWEYATKETSESYALILPLLPNDSDYINEDNRQESGRRIFPPQNIVLAGAAAFWLGVRLARDLLRQDNVLGPRQSVSPDDIGTTWSVREHPILAKEQDLRRTAPSSTSSKTPVVDHPVNADFRVIWWDAELRRVRDSPFAESDLDRQFKQQRDRFSLFICEDLSEQLVTVKSKRKHIGILLKPRHLRFLNLLFWTLKQRGTLDYDRIAVYALGAERYKPLYSDKSIHGLKSGTDGLLKGLLSRCLKPEKGQRLYSFKADLAFCWIRRTAMRSIMALAIPIEDDWDTPAT